MTVTHLAHSAAMRQTHSTISSTAILCRDHFTPHSPPVLCPLIPPGLPQGSVYQYSAGPPNGYQWGQQPAPTRSMSTGEPEDLAHGFSNAYRTNTYPSFERRMTGEMQHIPSTSAAYVTMSMGSSSSTIPTQLREPSIYHPIHMGMQQDWSGGAQSAPLAGTTGGGYPSSWYPQQGLAGLREEEDHAHILASQGHRSRRGAHNPG